MKIRRNDMVKMITGKDKGKTGKVIQVFSLEKRIVVEGLNTMVKNLRSKRKGEKGQKIHFSAPLDISHVMLVCPKCGKNTRVRYKLIEEQDESSQHKKIKKFRICRKCDEVI